MRRTKLVNHFIIISLILLSNVVLAQEFNTNAFQVIVTGKGKPMVLIPGATCSGDEWNETVARYSKNYECHVITLAGYAGIPPISTQPYLNTFKNQLIKYIRDKKLNGVILIGHSIGGFLSLDIASELKDHLKKVIVVDAMPFFAGALNPDAKSGFNEDQAKYMLSDYNQMNDAQLKANQLAIARTLCADSTKWDMIANWGAKSDRKTMAYTVTEMMGSDLRKKIASIQVPVLIMAAYAPSPQYPQYTKEYALASYKQQYQECKTCEVHISPTSKHFIMYDATEWYNLEIDNFIGIH